MKFGRVETEELNSLDLSLPPESPENSRILGGKKAGKTGVFVGCAKWGRDEWVGMIYPEGTKAKDFLENYVDHFNGIELNATFYNAKKDNIEKWATVPRDEFKFCPKFPQRISHIKRLKEVEDFTEWFLSTVTAFDNYLGLPFLQMPDNFTPKYIDRLAGFLEYASKFGRFALELRHTDWFTDETVFDDLCSILEKHQITLIITDSAGRRDCVHQRLTTTSTFIRFIGYDGHDTDYSRMDEWASLIKSWIDNGLENIYFFLHQKDEANTVISADYMARKLNEICGLKLKLPTFLNK